ncbi:4'-phosphopantetheinyl transferase family protein [Oceanirhabdus seepicola]|uniref:4'-phosphopantetheinyl transferase superfamily protein n=1 Tax=Oceanirhabdus seepicola TaxID=2828781 RepID=A0A9J6NWV8_9CLOT|nr:4'-phosphopantetheinyl transferase superfamily protein [Oceanirhabdus seepicola]
MKALAIIKDIDVNYAEQLKISLIPKERQDRVALFTDKLTKERFLAVEQSASQFAAISFGIPVSNFSGGIGEKPYFKDYPDISVSRSYAGEYIVIAAERQFSIGVDCEEVQDFNSNIAKYFFTHKERKYIESSKDRNTAFTVIWTRKESYIKCMGRGIDYPINTIDVTPIKDIENIPGNKPIFSENEKINNYYINSYIFEKIVISICSENNDVFPIIDQIYEGVIR